MAGTAVYLASLAGSYCHGQEIVIDGGEYHKADDESVAEPNPRLP